MISQFVPHINQYRIVLNRQEAETVANSSTKWDLLLKMLEMHKDRDEFIVYGNKYTILEALGK